MFKKESIRITSLKSANIKYSQWGNISKSIRKLLMENKIEKIKKIDLN
jgi:hypothetical protein